MYRSTCVRTAWQMTGKGALSGQNGEVLLQDIDNQAYSKYNKGGDGGDGVSVMPWSLSTSHCEDQEKS